MRSKYIRDIAEGAAIGSAAVWICFRNIFFLLLVPLFIPFFLKYKKERHIQENQSQMRTEFKNIMAHLYSVTAAGGTLAGALRDALREMKSSPERYPVMIHEFEKLCHKLDINVPLEKALNDFSDDCNDEDIRHFVQILTISGRSGGSLPGIIKRSSEAVSMRMEMSEEIETILAGRRAELRIMLIIPAFILVYMNISSPDYMSVLYSAPSGHMIMAAALCAYIAAMLAGRRILDIKV